MSLTPSATRPPRPRAWLRQLLGERRAARRGGRRRTDHEPNPGLLLVPALALAVAAVDWVTKAMVAATVRLGDFVEVWPGRVAFWHVRNDAMMLGLWGDLPLQARQTIAALSALLGVLLVLAITGRGHRLPGRQRGWAWAFVGLAAGGMLGNLGERLVHWGVTDYLSLHWGGYWLPPGNVADLALFASFLLAPIVVALELRARARRGSESTPAALASPLEPGSALH